MGWHQKVIGFALDQIYGCSSQPSGILSLILSKFIGTRGHHVRNRFTANNDGKGHGLFAGQVPLLHNGCKLAGGLRPACEQIFGVSHEPVHAPIGPSGFRVLRDNDIPSPNVAPSVPIVHHRSRQLIDVHLRAKHDVVLARR